MVNSDSLQDFCDTYLAYLLDDGFKVVIDNKFEDLFTIRLTQSSDNGNWLESDNPFIWDSIKDHYVPFLQMLSRNYKVSDFAGNKQIFVITGDHRHQNNLFHLSDVISGEVDQKLSEMVIGNIIVMVSADGLSGPEKLRRQGIVESSSVNLQPELEYQAEVFLAPLEEEGFSYEVRRDYYGSDFFIRLSFLDLGNSGSAVPINKLFDYTDVMDRFIPFVRILSRRYDLLDQVYFYSTQELDASKKVFTVDQIVNDVKPNFLVSSVKLTVKGKLQKVVESRKSTTESTKFTTDEVKDFTEDCLAYLLDDGFEITTYHMAQDDKLIVIWIDKPGPNKGQIKTWIGFEWDEVKDYYIPFVQLLAKRYQLGRFEQVSGVDYPVRFDYSVNTAYLEDFTYEQIVEDNLFLPEQGKDMLPYKVTKSGFATWEKIYRIGIKVNL